MANQNVEVAPINPVPNAERSPSEIGQRIFHADEINVASEVEIEEGNAAMPLSNNLQQEIDGERAPSEICQQLFHADDDAEINTVHEVEIEESIGATAVPLADDLRQDIDTMHTNEPTASNGDGNAIVETPTSAVPVANDSKLNEDEQAMSDFLLAKAIQAIYDEEDVDDVEVEVGHSQKPKRSARAVKKYNYAVITCVICTKKKVLTTDAPECYVCEKCTKNQE